MGPARDQVLMVDEEKFRVCVLDALTGLNRVSALRFFEIVHAAWDACLFWPHDKPVIFFHIHNPSPMELAQCLTGFEEAQLLNVVREPLQSLESWMRECLRDEGTAENRYTHYFEAVSRFDEMLNVCCNVSQSLYTAGAIRLEDIKRLPEKALPALAAWMGVANHPCLRESTFAGLEYDAPASTPVKGFETSNLERKPGALFSEYDQRVMNLLLYPIAVQYGYREADAAYLERELAWYQPLIAEPLDFEKKILAQLAEMGYQKDTSGPRRHFESIAQRCIGLLEQFGTYPAMAPWLKVD